MKTIRVMLGVMTMMLAPSSFCQCPCNQVNGVQSAFNKSEIKRYKVCLTYSERERGLLAHVECIPGCKLDYGYYLSRDGGDTWSSVADPESSTSVRTFATGKSTKGISYRAAATGQGAQKQWLLERSNDRGKSWFKLPAIWVGTGKRITWFVNVHVCPGKPEIVYATTVLPGTVNNRWQLFVSKDGGETFKLLLGDVFDFAVSSGNSDVIYAITFFNSIVKSIDKGLTWNQIELGGPFREPHANGGRDELLSIDVDLSDPNTVFVLTSDGVLRSQDGGATWCLLDLGLKVPYEPCSLVVDPENTKRLLVGTYDKGLLRSNDGGSNWKPVDISNAVKK